MTFGLLLSIIIITYYTPETVSELPIASALETAKTSPVVAEVFLEHHFALKSKICLPRYAESFSFLPTLTSFENRCCVDDTIKLLPENATLRPYYEHYHDCFFMMCDNFQRFLPRISAISFTPETTALLKRVYTGCLSMVFEPYPEYLWQRLYALKDIDNLDNINDLWLWSHYGIGPYMTNTIFNSIDKVTLECILFQVAVMGFIDILPCNCDFHFISLSVREDYDALRLLTPHAKAIIFSFQNIQRVLENLDIGLYNLNISFIKYHAKVYHFLH